MDNHTAADIPPADIPPADIPPAIARDLLAAVGHDADDQTIERERARKFLVSHWLILAVTALTMAANMASGALGSRMIPQFFSMVFIIGAMTAYGTLRYRRGQSTSKLITWILYLDSALGLVYFYLMGEYETPSMGFLTIPLIMAPVYTRRRTVWGIAGLQIALYLLLMAGRTGGWLDPYLHYGAMVVFEEGSKEQFLVLSIGAFITVTVAVAMLAGEASLDVVTSRAQLEAEVLLKTRQLGLVNDRLSVTNTDLAEFNAAISHDLRSPLQTLTLNLELLLDQTQSQGHGTVPPPDLHTRLIKTLTAAERMGQMITDLQDMARTSRAIEDIQPVNLDEIYGQVVEDLSARVVQAGAVIERVDTLPVVQGNVGLLRRLVQNLVENAIKYGQDGAPTVQVGPCSDPSGLLGFYVEDDGQGIEEKDQDRIFALFQRLERDEGREGTGAGLAIVHRIVEGHRGQIRVCRGQKLCGARFEVLFSSP
ncbi:MAG: hypothetical protein GXP62_01265 [Oligoflexia bacterium]|nr:hypothetical protein [Oligoflexia bacterium]